MMVEVTSAHIFQPQDWVVGAEQASGLTCQDCQGNLDARHAVNDFFLSLSEENGDSDVGGGDQWWW